MRYNPGACA